MRNAALIRLLPAVAGCLAMLVCASLSIAEDAKEEKEAKTIDLRKFQLTAPEGWERQKPKSRIVEHEFSAPASEGDDVGVRITMMHSGGTIDDNIDRWRGQFAEIDPDNTKEPETRTIAGQEVRVVDISGSFMDRPNPMAAGVERENYRMLAAIVVLKEGNFFVKLTGPRRTLSDQEENFNALLDSLELK